MAVRGYPVGVDRSDDHHRGRPAVVSCGHRARHVLILLRPGGLHIQ